MLLLAVTRFEAYKPFSNEADKDDIFSSSTPGYCTLKRVETTIEKLKELKEHSQNHLKSLGEEVIS